MLKRKIQAYIEQYLKSNSNKMLVIDGARQIGKSFIIREVGSRLFPNFIEVNFAKDKNGPKVFAEANTVEKFYFQLSTIAGEKMREKVNTLVFLDEIQAYPHMLTMVKFLKEDDRFTYIASGSQLGVTLRQTVSIPVGSLEIKHMYQLDFEEFLWANGFGETAISELRKRFENEESLDENLHVRMLDLFKRYLLIGGMPDAVNAYLDTRNIVAVRKIQEDIRHLYALDASQYDEEHKLKIMSVYNMVPSNMENKKKRLVYKSIEGSDKRWKDYADEIDYLVGSGITLDVKAISSPSFPLVESASKNLIKLYFNDVGLLTDVLYQYNVSAVLNDELSVNLGSVYESVVASELRAHGHELFYYDNKAKGEVDYIVDDYESLSVLPIEVKSGKNYQIHHALNAFAANEDYKIKRGIVFSNEREVRSKGIITYLPIYYVMFLEYRVPERLLI
ncbi:MAG: ATP-binding protein [Bacteroidales bacterium]|nr:ATP-binding protein [Bacteroidales bacterium]